MTFASTQEKQPLPSQEGSSSGTTKVNGEPLPGSEIHVIGEDEFLNHVQQCCNLASMKFKVCLPNYIKKDCDTKIDHIQELCQGKYYWSVFFHSSLLMSRILEEKKTPNKRGSKCEAQNQSNHHTPLYLHFTLNTYKPKQKSTKPTSINSCTLAFNFSQSNGNEA